METTPHITEEWLRDMGFRWHQLERQPHKHWVLWLADAIAGAGHSDLGIELSPTGHDDEWFCWLRSDTAHRYHRFIHVRYLTLQREVVQLIEAIAGQDFRKEHVWYGALRKPEQAARFALENERMDVQIRRGNPKWSEIEKDHSRGGALPEHMEAAIDSGKAQ